MFVYIVFSFFEFVFLFSFMIVSIGILSRDPWAHTYSRCIAQVLLLVLLEHSELSRASLVPLPGPFRICSCFLGSLDISLFTWRMASWRG